MLTCFLSIASVLAANAVMRSCFGAAFPLFTTNMYDALGIHWASSIPAFLALACVPFPFLFYRYGPAIRKRCKYASEAEAFMLRLRQAAQQDDDSASTEEHGSPTPNKEGNQPLTGHNNAQDREAQLEAEAMDYSYGEEQRQPAFEAIKLPGEKRSNREMGAKKSHRSLHRARSATYDASPYDIDRVNTNESFGQRPPNSRTSSRRGK